MSNPDPVQIGCTEPALFALSKKLAAMGFFSRMLTSRDLPEHQGKALWNYNLTEFEFIQLQAELNTVRFNNLDTRDAALYFAEWWKRSYNGGLPSKYDVYASLGRAEVNILTPETFYESARRGAEALGVKWIQKQNVLYFRTLLLQGGIPIKHVAENKSYYQAFLLSLLELQPASIEEISADTQLTRLLPISSRNDVVYENCLSIIRSIISDEDTYTSLFESHGSLKQIREALLVRKRSLSTKARIVRPKIYWVMHDENGNARITLHAEFGSKYSAASLQEVLNLPSPAEERTYSLYLDDKLICSFRKMLNGDYKTEWEKQKLTKWHPGNLTPHFYFISNDEKWEINDLVPAPPSIEEPSLWTVYDGDKWRLVKGNTVNTKKALLLLPENWQHPANEYHILNIDNHKWKAIQFEGEQTVTNGELAYKFCSDVESFEWHIQSEKPSWMRKSDIVVVSRRLKIYVYDSEEKLVEPRNFKVYFKRSASELWKLSEVQNSLPIGLLHIKIEYKAVIAYDMAYNIGDLKLGISAQTLDRSTLNWNNPDSFKIIIPESSKFSTRVEGNRAFISLNTQQPTIPEAIPVMLKCGNQKSLKFDVATPFSGVGLIDRNGIPINENGILTLNDLHGIRILATNAGETVVKMWNKLRDQVKIYKTISFAYQPLISYKEELQRLFYLSDGMSHENMVVIEISNGKSKRAYRVKGFSHTINDISTQFEGKIKVEGSNLPSALLAVPINVEPENIRLYCLEKGEEDLYHLPVDATTGQFIVFSDIIDGKQLQPRFINTDSLFQGQDYSERTARYVAALLNPGLDGLPWKEVLTYYNICVEYKIPFSTFDQIRVLGRSSCLAAKAFFALGINQNIDEFIQRQVPALEQDLGFCFHWIAKEDWINAYGEAEKSIDEEYRCHLAELILKYFQEINLNALFKLLSGGNISNGTQVTNQIINDARSKLGSRVLNELPTDSPNITTNYNVPIDSFSVIKLLLRAPIAVAESITGRAEQSIWKSDAFVANLRRNIQYAYFVSPDLYSRILYQCLSNSN